MKKSIFIIILVLAGFYILPGTAEIAPNEVRAYIQSHFKGPFLSWTLDAGMRQKLDQQISGAWVGKIKSLDIGNDVGVMLFQNKYFKFSGSGYITFTSVVPDINKALPGADTTYSSLIVFPKVEGNPRGVLVGNSGQSDFRFFPLPQTLSERTYGYADIRHLVSPIDFVLLFPGKSGKYGIVVKLYLKIGFNGPSIQLPQKSGQHRYNLKDLGIVTKVQSLKLEQREKLLQMQLKNDRYKSKQPQKYLPQFREAKSVSKVSGCSIAGTARGAKANLSPLYKAVLYGPGNLDKKWGTVKFNHQGRFLAANIPCGRYRIIIQTDPGKADLPVNLNLPTPSEITVVITYGKKATIDFFFN